MKNEEVLQELYDVGRRIQHSLSDPSDSTKARFIRALDEAQKILFPDTKRVVLKTVDGSFALMGERLAEIGIGELPWRWVKRSNLRELRSGQSKPIPLFEGQNASYLNIEADLYSDSLTIGCKIFEGEAFRQIQKWLKEKPVRRKKK